MTDQHAAPLPPFPVSVEEFKDWLELTMIPDRHRIATITYNHIRTRYEAKREGGE